MAKVTAKGIWTILKASFKGFSEDKVPKLSASLAYYTVFSLGPLLVIIIVLAGIFLGREAIEGSVVNQLQGFVGADAASQIQEIIKNASVSGKGPVALTIGIITLLIGATSVFAEIQDSINSIWGLKAKPKAGLGHLIKNRLLSFGIIGSLGFLLLVSLAVTAVVEGLNKKLQSIFPDVTVVIFYVLNLIITLAVVTVLFAVIFKVLPDAKLKWKQVWGGAIATALLFMIGKTLIGLYVSKSDIGSTYGTAGSMVVLLVWIYYSSMILYFGAEFSKAWVLQHYGSIEPNEYAVLVKKEETEEGPAADGKRSPQRSRQQQPAYVLAHAQRREPHQKESLQYDSNSKPLGMVDLFGALALAAVQKISDWAEPGGEKKNSK